MWFFADPVLSTILVLQIIAIQQANCLKFYLLCHGNGLYLVYFSNIDLLYPGGLLSNTGMLLYNYFYTPAGGQSPPAGVS